MFLLSILLSLFGTIGTVKADTDEVAGNQRSRSAIMRIAEKIA